MLTSELRQPPVIAVIGDGDVPELDRRYIAAYRLGRELAANGFIVLTGGKGGVMEGASKGAALLPDTRFGQVIALLPGQNTSEANPYVHIAIPTGMNHLRNALVARADAVIAIGGQAGTLSEMAFAWMHGRMLIGYRDLGWSGKLAGTRIDERKRIALTEDQVFAVDNEREVLELLNKYLPLYLETYQGKDKVIKEY